MKIGNVNYCTPYSTKSSSQNFKGLWGKEEIITEDERRWSSAFECDFGEFKQITVKEYYPFMDETEDDIKKIKAQEFIDKTIPDEINTVEYVSGLKINIMPTIPVTADEYKAYIARELLSKQEMDVEDRLKTAKMQKFLR